MRFAFDTSLNKHSIRSPWLKKSLTTGLAVVLVCSLSGCGTMSTRDKNMAVGAGIGAVTGAVLTGGSSLGTVGGAAVGGIIGHQIGK